VGLIRSNNAEPKCSGKSCGKLAPTRLKILYIVNKTGFFCDFCSQHLAKRTGYQRRRKSLDMQKLTDSNDDEDISSIFETATAKIECIICDDSHYRVLPVS
jgi:ribosomal protein S27E